MVVLVPPKLVPVLLPKPVLVLLVPNKLLVFDGVDCAPKRPPPVGLLNRELPPVPNPEVAVVFPKGFDDEPVAPNRLLFVVPKPVFEFVFPNPPNPVLVPNAPA